MKVAKEMEEAMNKAWLDWHRGFKPDEMPERPNISFERGFQYGFEFANQTRIAVAIKNR